MLRPCGGMLMYLACRLALPLARRAPPPLAYPVLDRLGDLLWLANRPTRRTVEANLQHVIGGRGPRWRRAVREAFRHGARNYYDTFRIGQLTAAEIAELVPTTGWEHLDQALTAGRGAILAGAHLSSVGLGGQSVAAQGHLVHVPVEPIEPPELLRLLTRARSGLGVRLVPLGPGLTGELLAALRRNEIIALMVDRDISGSGVLVPFFGAPARLPAGPATLALRSGAPVLPAFTIRRPDGRFEGVVEPPIPVVRSGKLRADVERTTRMIAARLEYYIGGHPEQWTMFQPVWEISPKSKVQGPRSGIWRL